MSASGLSFMQWQLHSDIGLWVPRYGLESEHCTHQFCLT